MVKGWAKKTLGDCFIKIVGGGTPSRGVSAFWHGAIPWATVKDFTTFDSNSTQEHISKAGLEHSASNLIPKGTLITATRMGLGRVVVYDIDIAINQDLKALFVCDKIDKCFIRQWFVFNGKKIEGLGTGSTVKGITLEQLKEIFIYIPNEYAEQAKIAEVLSDTDEYIAVLEKLIAKKKAIKVGTMQELLAGKRRLKGFTGEWVEKENIFMFYKGEQRKTADTGAYPHYNGGQENSNYTDQFNASDSIIISEGGNSCGYVNHIRGKFWAGGHCYLVEVGDFNKTYLFQLLKLYEPKIMALRVGSGLPNIQKKELSGLKFFYTIDGKEQTAIAQILSDIDAEIEALTAKLQKVKAVKIGMMQQLLTGQIRLVEVADDSRLQDAVILSGIVDIWGREPVKYPLGRVKVAKLFYLYTRKTGGNISRFHEHAAGPYDETIRHGGGEILAAQNGYIEIEDRGDSSKFTCGKNIAEAKKQLYDFDAVDTLKWLADNFRMTRVDELELLATVDFARFRIEEAGGVADAQSVYDYISQSADWAQKLSRAEFHISYIAETLKQSRLLFGNGGQA